MAVPLTLILGSANTGLTLTGKVYAGGTLAGSPTVTESPASSGTYIANFSAAASTSYGWAFEDGAGESWGGGSFVTDGDGNEITLGDVGTGGGSTGSGDVPIDHNTPTADAMRVTHSGSGVDGVRVIAYVAADYSADPSGAEPEAETTTKADGRWNDALNLDDGIEYTIRFSKSGYTIPNATVTP